MAKKKLDREYVRLKSTESECVYYTFRRKADEKLALNKYDNILKKHTLFKENKRSGK
jgi:ribosomal protein L33